MEAETKRRYEIGKIHRKKAHHRCYAVETASSLKSSAQESPSSSQFRTESWSVIPGCLAENIDFVSSNGAKVIDLRSPVEYEEDHLPGAINVPLLDNDERAIVGTLYKQISPDDALEKGLEFVEKRISELVESIRGVADRSPSTESTIVGEQTLSSVFSEVATQLHSVRLEVQENDSIPKSVGALLRRLGWERIWVIKGGYKAIRKSVRDTLASNESIARCSLLPVFCHFLLFNGSLLPSRVYVLSGMTGVGKTRILNRIEAMQGDSTIDLEGIAGHRSSLLGHVGLQPTSQKAFESELLCRLHNGFPNGYAVVESESRKVGNSIIPPAVWENLINATRIDLVAPMEVRVTRLCEEYLRDDIHRQELEKALPHLERVMRGSNKDAFVNMLRQGRERELTRLLIEQWYDLRYRDRGLGAIAQIDTTDEDMCAKECLKAIEQDAKSSSTL
eukprot:jgi/Bigna1/128083/aug1.5_g2791